MRHLQRPVNPFFILIAIITFIGTFGERVLARPNPAAAPADSTGDLDILNGGVVLGNRGLAAHSWCKTWQAALDEYQSSKSAASASSVSAVSASSMAAVSASSMAAASASSVAAAAASASARPRPSPTRRGSGRPTASPLPRINITPTNLVAVPPLNFGPDVQPVGRVQGRGQPSGSQPKMKVRSTLEKILDRYADTPEVARNSSLPSHQQYGVFQNIMRKILRRDDNAKPANPCRDENPSFPDEGPPNEVLGCNQDIMTADQTCPRKWQNSGGPDDTTCSSFCEVRREYFYGREQRFHPAQEIWPYPDAPRISVTKGESVTITLGFSMDMALNIIPLSLALGTGMQMSKSWTWSNARSYISPDWNTIYPYCAFFTFIPKMVRSCGTLSRWPRQTIATMAGVTPMCAYGLTPENTQNLCVEVPWLNSNDEVEGVITLG
ncbi:hypothetical protein ABW21_db0204258 [Orbilia brochopaga]|nr:hypothetical protein ABW21_db0204258 [Drechslerella brochopaga]